MIRQRWLMLVLLSVAAAAVWAHAQESDDAFNRRLSGPEIWRLPPVTHFPSMTPTEDPPEITFQMPMALVVPPIEMIPAPRPKAQESEAAQTEGDGSSPSDLPTGKGHIEVKPERIKLWSGSFTLGLDGSEGNTETLNLHFGVHTQRKTECNALTMGLDYTKQTSKTIATADRFFLDVRDEQLLNSSRWSVFFHETIEYDQFQPFDVRDTSDAGLGYRIINREDAILVGRFGGGFSHEYGGPENGKYIPEAVFGLQFEQQLNKRQKFLGSMEYAPDVTRFTRYRLRTQAAWEVLLDDGGHLNLRIGVLERYNSVPNGARPNDLDYAMMLMWKF